MAAAAITKKTLKVKGLTFVYDDTYTLNQELLGTGAYGAVISAVHVPSEAKVAIKRVHNMFNPMETGALTDSKRILRELKLMRHLSKDGGCNHVIKIRDIMTIPEDTRSSFTEIYVVSELMPYSLRKIIKDTRKRGHTLDENIIKSFTAQLLNGIGYIHAAEVLHRDIKPENIVVDQQCNLKVIDFGLARHVTHGALGYTEYVQTRWYRAPEIVLNRGRYGKAADVWAIGCIMAELFHLVPVFPGNDYAHQLEVVFDVLGTGDDAGLDTATRDFVRSMTQRPRKDLRALWGASAESVPVLWKFLCPDSTRRRSCADLLQEVYFEAYHSPIPVPRPFTDYNFERGELNFDTIRRGIVEEMLHYHPEPGRAKPASIGIPEDTDVHHGSLPSPSASETWNDVSTAAPPAEDRVASVVSSVALEEEVGPLTPKSKMPGI